MSELLPDAENAIVPEDKVRGYILNPEHADGQHKCRVFFASLAIGPDDWEHMTDQLRTQVVGAAVSSTRPAKGCTLYEVPIQVQGLNGQEKRVRSVWKVSAGGGPPSFVTAYLDKRAT